VQWAGAGVPAVVTGVETDRHFQGFVRVSSKEKGGTASGKDVLAAG
jgi:hypothetical protein